MIRSWSLAPSLLLLLGLAGCAKSSANSAVARAEKDIAQLPPDAAKIAPVEVKALNDSVGAMKANIEKGDFRAALMGARSVSSLARDLSFNLNARKTQLTAAYNAAADEVPKQLDSLAAKVEELGKMRRLPPGIDAARFAQVKANVDVLRQQWTAATQAHANGEIAAALAKANEVKAKVADAMKVVGMAG